MFGKQILRKTAAVGIVFLQTQNLRRRIETIPKTRKSYQFLRFLVIPKKEHNHYLERAMLR